MKIDFKEDQKVQQMAEAYAEDTVAFAAKQFKIKLDWSDDSIAQVETILDLMHKHSLKDKPTKEQIFDFAKGLGSYVGEVYRRNHGASWGMVTMDAETLPGLKTEKSGQVFWPWGKANNRIINGEEDNIWHYYQMLVQKDDPKNASPLQRDNKQEKKKSWLKRIIGG
jgi:hypothetical protein